MPRYGRRDDLIATERDLQVVADSRRRAGLDQRAVGACEQPQIRMVRAAGYHPKMSARLPAKRVGLLSGWRASDPMTRVMASQNSTGTAARSVVSTSKNGRGVNPNIVATMRRGRT